MEKITLNIDGQTVETIKGKSVLEAALNAGMYIPHLCYHADLSPLGACRLCVIEIEGLTEIPTSCTVIVENGMVIQTNTEKLHQMRRLAMELMMATHPSDCTGCPKYMKCELQSLTQYLGISSERFRKRPVEVPIDTSNPLILHDFTRCVRCGRCVRACRELREVEVLNYQKRNGETHIGTDLKGSLADSGCKFCGACIEVCPTGALRDQEGVLKVGVTREAAVVPCRSSCPAEIDIPRYVRYIKDKNYSAATAVIREKVPFPEVLGSICDHKCETQCRRNHLTEPVSICRLKGFAAQNDDKQWKVNIKQASPTNKKVAIVGAGPAGLTAAYYLAKQGHSVTVFEALPLPGGQCRVGIPEYRLSRDILEAEVEEIKSMGVEIRTDSWIDSLDNLFAKGYNAILVAVGTHQGIKLPIPGTDLKGVFTSTAFLREVNLRKKVEVGNKVLVLGGGNVAFDCARVARRLGAGKVQVVCLEAKANMPASGEEIKEAEKERVIINPSVSFTGIIGEEEHVTGVECYKVKSFSFDDSGKAKIEVFEGSKFILEAETVVFAVGQKPDIPAGFGLTVSQGNKIEVDPDTLVTNRAGVFAAGDAVTGTHSVIAAIVAGRKGASSIDKFLGGDGIIDEQLIPVEDPTPWLGREENFAYQNRFGVSYTPAEERIKSFGQAWLSYDEQTACQEAKRCLQCDLRLNISQPRFWGDFSTRK